VVEKTCANSLRVSFVDRVVPEAKFVSIVRDGRDAAASARRRWHAKLEPGYAVAKARFVPPTDLAYYAAAHLGRRLHRLRSLDGRLGSWGPRLRDMDELLATRSLVEVCALQWQRCVDLADRDLAQLNSSRVHRVRYEDFVDDPAAHLAGIAAFAGRPAAEADVRAAVSHVAPDRASAPREQLSADEHARIEALVERTLAAHGYG
jgi:hypothetical protein